MARGYTRLSVRYNKMDRTNIIPQPTSMVLDDDNDEKWIYREHTAAKHEVYRKYLTPWTNKLTSYNHRANQFNKVRIVDCFAGRGEYVRTEGCDSPELQSVKTPPDHPGSPQIILDKMTQRSDQFSEAECIFIEDNDTNFEILDKNISQTTGVSNNINKRCIHGKFQDEIRDLVRTDGTDCPTFFFMDPFGFKSLNYEVITEIGSTPQFEFLITFMSRDINRFFENEDHQDSLENLFGNNSYVDEVGEIDPNNWEPLVEYYSERLEENGPSKTFEYLITEPDTRQTVYYLVFGTNHPNGLKTMREVMNTCGTGSFGYAPKHIEHDRQQQGLAQFGAGSAESETENFLLEEFEDYRIEFGRLIDECSELRPYSDDMESDYRSTIQRLEGEGKLEVVRIKSKQGGTGIQRGDLIDFRDKEGLE